MIDALRRFNEETRVLHDVVNREDLYKFFKIPKKSGGFRQISAPQPQLMEALRQLKYIFESILGARYLYHTSAFAYINGRNTIQAIQRHQANKSKFFCKTDMQDFFGSTTKEFVLSMFAMIFPLSLLMNCDDARRELETAIDLAFLHGGLPQGTPISPLITNIMMIPIDHELSNTLHDFNGKRFVYTRYADDIQVSSRSPFMFKEIEALIMETCNKFGAPFRLNLKKTRYGSSAGSNWNLGLMLNKDNNITIGHQKKREFKAALASYIMDHKSGVHWALEDIRTLDGLKNYYLQVEKEAIKAIIQHANEKFCVDVERIIRNDLSHEYE